ncbi:MAG: T9SS type A sorting domain-containing protein [Balneola sp.]|jgi:hypothetical protein
MKYLSFLAFLFFIHVPFNSNAQVTYKWLDVGSFHNFYSNIGSEIEEGFKSEHQSGWQWPAIYKNQDAQVFKGLWLGVENYTDSSGVSYDKRVVHVGPRVDGEGEFFPVSIETSSRFEKPYVSVDGRVSEMNSVEVDEIDPNLKADREIVTVTNSLIGITVKRTIKQFSQQYHDNYHIIEYVFTNTGNIDGDDFIELPDQEIKGFIPFLINDLAHIRESRYTIGNATGWGQNTMIDRRGDGQFPLEENKFRAHYTWHGKYAPFYEYDNLGAPIIEPSSQGGYLSADDTTGRLAAYHFGGTVTLHADVSASNSEDDSNQPFTMNEVHSDNMLFSNNNAFNETRMAAEYDLMIEGRSNTRHALRVEPTGYEGFTNPVGDPALGNNLGGFSYTNGYGPYDLAPGESIRIVIADASSGISKELAYETGKKFKNGEISAEIKNQIVFQGRDSLFQTFDRAISNFESGYNIYKGPESVSNFSVDMASVGVDLSWEYDQNESDISGFEIYRTHEKVDSAYTLVYRADPDERQINDNVDNRNLSPDKFFSEAPEPGTGYFYHIVTVAKSANNDSTGSTPTGQIFKSSRYYTQTYDPVYVITSVGIGDEPSLPKDIILNQNYPNPFNPSTTISYYLSDPKEITLTIFNSIGQQVAVLVNSKHSVGTHSVVWNASNFTSGVYFYQLSSSDFVLTKRLLLLK